MRTQGLIRTVGRHRHPNPFSTPDPLGSHPTVVLLAVLFCRGRIQLVNQYNRVHSWVHSLLQLVQVRAFLASQGGEPHHLGCLRGFSRLEMPPGPDAGPGRVRTGWKGPERDQHGEARSREYPYVIPIWSVADLCLSCYLAMLPQ